MMRSLRYGLVLGALAAGSLALAQGTEPTVSGPAQENPGKSTGKSYKKGSKRKPVKKENPNTGQTHRLGNTGRLTKDKAASGSDTKSGSSSQPK